VLVPHFSQVAVNDNWERTQEVDVIPRLLSKVVRDTAADRNHLYTTGQSMGGMISLYLSATHPTLFAASLFVACQWDASILAPLGKQRFLYIVAGGDQKASKGMEELKKRLMGSNVSAELRQEILIHNWSCSGFSTTEIDPRSPYAEEHLAAMLFNRYTSRRIFLTFPKGAVLPPDGSGHEHVCSFDHAYRLRPVLEWLLARPPKTRHHAALQPITNS
jgi:predicted peptidase